MISKETIDKDLSNNANPFINNISWAYHENVYSAFEGAHAAVLLTEWEIYKTLDWKKILHDVNKPFWVFDTRSILNPKEMNSLEINFWQLGYGNNN